MSQDATDRPDFSGVWFPRGFSQRTPRPYPFTAAAPVLVDDFTSKFTQDDDPGKYCIWPGMPRVIWGAPFSIEMFHRDHDLTIYFEGYGMYRKIFMADHNPPEPILPTAMGHSVGHWEGETLVVETTHLRPYPYMDDLATSSDAHVLERYWLEQREVDGEMHEFLLADLTLTDPKIYTQPIRIQGEIRREPDMTVLEYTCSVSLWEEYLLERGLTLPDIDALPEPQ